MQCGPYQIDRPTDPETGSNTNRPGDAQVNCFGDTIDIDAVMDALGTDDGRVSVSHPGGSALPMALAASTAAALKAPAKDDDTPAVQAAIARLRNHKPLPVDTGAAPYRIFLPRIRSMWPL